MAHRHCLALALVLAFSSPCFSKLRYDVKDLIKADGYPVEAHHILTDDGYILELHRIPHGRNETTSSYGTGSGRPPVLLVHCIMCSSAAFVVLGPNGGLAYMLANEGFDVWLLNVRGNDYSRQHLNQPVKSRRFWQFSWHEIGVYDVPSSIDFVLKKTKYEQLDLIGFSMGTTALFVALSERSEYNSKVRSLTALAPAVFFPERPDAFLVDISFLVRDSVIKIAAETGELEFAGASSGFRDLFRSACQPNNFLFRKLCTKGLLLTGGILDGYVNRKTLPFYFKYFPSPTSLRTVIHFLQIIESGKFQKYSYGSRLNKRIYGSRTPPSYDLSKVTAPVNLFWSIGDNLTPPKGARKLARILPNVKFGHEIQLSRFSHVGFIWARNAHTTVYNTVLERLKGS